MTDRSDIVAAAEALLAHEGFSATGMDRLTRAAGVSTRTLYKHVGGRAGLIDAALEARDRRFLQTMPRDGTHALFCALATWIEREGAHGCFFLRALGEVGGNDPSVPQRVAAHKAATATLVEACVAADLGRPLDGDGDAMLVEQIIVLLEGATHAAIHRGTSAVDAADRAADVLITAARGCQDNAQSRETRGG